MSKDMMRVRVKGDYRDYLRDEYCDVEVYFEQSCNLIVSVIRFTAYWLFGTVVLTASIAIVGFLFMNTADLTHEDVVYALRRVTAVAGVVSLAACVLTNAGRFKNVFDARASEKWRRHKKIRANTISECKTVEIVLMHYGLISQDDIDNRPAKWNMPDDDSDPEQL